METKKTTTKRKIENAPSSTAVTTMEVDPSSGVEGSAPRGRPSTAPPSGKRSRYPGESEAGGAETRKVPVPSHRYGPLKESWLKIFTPVVEHMKLQVRFNLKTRNVEIRTCKETEDLANLQKAADFVRAFVFGFDVEDALALLRLDDLFIDSFEIQDVKTLKGDHLARAIGRIAGKNGQIKNIVENTTKTRIVLADSRIHILGSYQNIQIAKRAICNLILGSPPSKMFGTLKAVVSRASERF